jgi:hypothetical protein
LPKEPVNKMPSVSLLNNGSMSNIIENNILSILNENLNNVHKSRNVNKNDNVYNIGTNLNHVKNMINDAPKKLIIKENVEVNNNVMKGENNCGASGKCIFNNNIAQKDTSNGHKDQNKNVTSTFKKEDRKHIDNFHVFTSYNMNTNAGKRNAHKQIFPKKNGNLFMDNNKNAENTHNNPIVLLDKKNEDTKVLK